ncbi:hypothetical protein GCM10007415_42420 [Parapedobacter pyrenivorans]|uniref:Thioredoxin domain-containing protein n=1 Tax=Parapedobacter pyrenivorans TaxID=1305674 RepID=A0A917I1Y9_9SPHI|nr:TlpA disulfide reductase family protein [Parapedobacter pyrenivorans]GGH01810.1 hypothetical protein GCM10007415_42420 [Parapedobacter pyrenivorans]
MNKFIKTLVITAAMLPLFLAGQFTAYATGDNVMSQSDSISISGTFRGAIAGIDTVTLFVWESMPPLRRLHAKSSTSYQQILVDGQFHFSIKPTSDIVYISLAYDKWNGQHRHLFNRYLSQRGDSINVTANFIELTNINTVSDSGRLIENDQLFFLGKGAGKYNMWKIAEKKANDLASEYYAWHQALQEDSGQENSEIERIFDRYQYIASAQLNWLNRFTPVCSPELFRVLRNELLAEISYTYLYRPLIFATKKITDSDRAGFDSRYHELVRDVPLPDTNKTSGAYGSYRLLDFTLSKIRVEGTLSGSGLYPLLKQRYTGLLRERLLTKYLSEQYSHLLADSAQSYLRDALQLVHDETNKQCLLSLQHLEKGAPVYNFSLPDRDGNVVTLSDFRGKIVFIDFFYTGCSNCASYFKKSVKPAKEYFRSNPEVVFMSVSIDGNRDKWIKSLESELYTSSDALNLYTDGKGAVHPIIESLKILGYPHPILIDREGKIFNNRYSELGQNDPPGLIARINEALKQRSSSTD